MSKRGDDKHPKKEVPSFYKSVKKAPFQSPNPRPRGQGRHTAARSENYLRAAEEFITEGELYLRGRAQTRNQGEYE